MKRFFCITLFALVLPASPALAEKPKLVVMPLQSSGLQPAAVTTMDELLTNAVRRLDQHRVVGKSDIDAMLGLENMKDQMGCDNVTCAAEIGGALGAELLLAGRVAKLGDNVIIVLKLIDAPRQNVVNSVQHKAPNDENVFDRAIEDAVKQLFGIEAPPAGTRTPGTGVLQVTTTPIGAEVLLDGLRVGRSPLSIPQVSAGTSHTLRVETSTHWPREEQVTVVEGETKRVEIALLTPLSITSSPSGAVVFINGRQIGNTPLTSGAEPGKRHLVRVEAPRHWPLEESVELTDGTKGTLAADLTPRQGPWQLAFVGGVARPVDGGDRRPVTGRRLALEAAHEWSSGLVLQARVFERGQAFEPRSSLLPSRTEIRHIGLGAGVGYGFGRRLRLVPSVSVEAFRASATRDDPWAASALGLMGSAGVLGFGAALQATWAFTPMFFAGVSLSVSAALYQEKAITSLGAGAVIGAALGEP